MFLLSPPHIFTLASFYLFVSPFCISGKGLPNSPLVPHGLFVPLYPIVGNYGHCFFCIYKEKVYSYFLSFLQTHTEVTNIKSLVVCPSIPLSVPGKYIRVVTLFCNTDFIIFLRSGFSLQ